MKRLIWLKKRAVLGGSARRQVVVGPRLRLGLAPIGDQRRASMFTWLGYTSPLPLSPLYLLVLFYDILYFLPSILLVIAS